MTPRMRSWYVAGFAAAAVVLLSTGVLSQVNVQCVMFPCTFSVTVSEVPPPQPVPVPAPAPVPVPAPVPAPAPAPVPVPVPATPPAVQPQSEPLLQQSDVVYLGAFRVPADTDPTNRATFEYGGTALAFNPESGGLYMVGHAQQQWVAELAVPAQIVSATSPAGLTRATYWQRFVDPLEGKRNDVLPSDPNGIQIGGILAPEDTPPTFIWISAFPYYTGGTHRPSHFSRPSDLSTRGAVNGPRTLTATMTDYVSGYMALVPNEWRTLIGAKALAGNCCIPIISRTSYGPSVDAFNPADGTDQGALLNYPALFPLAPYSGSALAFGATTQIKGLVWPYGTRSVLFFGRTGTGPYCYGTGTRMASLAGLPVGDGSVWCYDPVDSDKGTHAYPYRYQIWAYDANDLLAVKQGTLRPWEPRPYGLWELTFPIDNTGKRLGGAAYDPYTGRVYVSQISGDGDRPLVHVFTVPRAALANQPAFVKSLERGVVIFDAWAR